MTLAMDDQRAPALAPAPGWAPEGGEDTEEDLHGETPRAKARAAFWDRQGPRLEGRRYKLRRSIPDHRDPDLTVQRGAVLVWRNGAWRTRYRAGIFNVTPNPHALRISDLSPLPNK